MFLPVQALPEHWNKALSQEYNKQYFLELNQYLEEEYQRHSVFPDKTNIFRAFQDLDIPQVRVVILGQDPYHGEGQAIGRAFAVPQNLQKKPPSLKNIFKELYSDLNLSPAPFDSELQSWAQQGVFLLNTVLTVRSGEAFSHKQKGWEIFTDKVLEILNSQSTSLHFVLWGAAAQSKKALITGPQHKVWQSAHPSPLSASRGFLGSKIFTKINQELGPSRAISWEKAVLESSKAF